MKQFKDVPGFEGFYIIDEYGNVFRNKIPMGQDVTKFGYMRTWLTVNSKTYYRFIHVLVAQAFLGPKPEGCEVNHKDGNKLNNHYTNLEWMKRQENIDHAWQNGLYKRMENSPNTELSKETVIELFNLRKQGDSYGVISKKLGINKWTVRDIVVGRTWKGFAELHLT